MILRLIDEWSDEVRPGTGSPNDRNQHAHTLQQRSAPSRAVQDLD